MKLVIDADPGIGDALGIMLALADPSLDVVGLTPVASFISRAQAARNLQTLVSIVDPDRWPRIAITPETPVEIGAVLEQAFDHRRQLNGLSGLGDWPVASVDPHHQREPAKLLIELSREFPQELIVLAWGPLTNVALAIERDPEFCARIKSLVILGGTYSAAGDTTPTAEFNMLADPNAASVVFHAPIPKLLVPLDLTRQLLLSFEFWNRLFDVERGRCQQLLRSLSTYALRSHRQFSAIEGMWPRAGVALATVSQPQFFQKRAGHASIELHGRLTSGMTVFDRREPAGGRPNIEVALEMDIQGVQDYLANLFRQLAHKEST